MSNMNPIKAAQNIGQYRLTFKANKEDKKLIDDSAREYYKSQALSNLYENTANQNAIGKLIEMYSESSTKCEILKDRLKFKMVGDCEYVSGYNVFFEPHSVEFVFEKGILDDTNIEEVANELYNKYKTKEN